MFDLYIALCALMFLINYFFDTKYKPMPKYEGSYVGTAPDLNMNTRAKNTNVQNMNGILKMLSVDKFNSLKNDFNIACDSNIAHNKNRIDDQWKLNHDKIPSSGVLLRNRGSSKSTHNYDRNDSHQTTAAVNPIASCEDKMAKLKSLLSRNKIKVCSDNNDSTTFCDKISKAVVDNQLITCINVDNINTETTGQDESSISDKSVVLEQAVDAQEPKNSSSDESQNEEDMSNSVNYEDIEDECDAAIEKKKSKKIAKHKRSKRNKNDKSDKTHTHTHNKHRSNSPIYFCTETVKLYTKKKSHVKNNSKRKSWLDSLVGRYVSFLNKAMCKNGRIKDKRAATAFDEINGTFDCDSSDDAFTVVFSDNPVAVKNRRVQLSSECDSEDSFVICFENDSDSVDGGCFINDDDFECDSWTSEDDSDCEIEVVDSSDEEPTLKIPQLKGCMKKRSAGPSPNTATRAKKVSFDPTPPRIHKIIAWKFAYHQARIGPWQDYARDSKRFKQRIIDMSVSLDWVLKREHRSRVYFQRFRPILMRQIREEKEAKKKEAEQLKIKEQEQLKREEEECLKLEEEKRLLLVEENEKLKAENKEEQQIVKEDECSCKEIQHKCDSTELIHVN